MADPKGFKLFVNVGASEARRRVKHFGHGVRKVSSAGRGQAVIVHTAYGKNLTELQAKFADVGFSGSESDLGEPVGNLKNIGPTTAATLQGVGIKTVADLERLGPVAAFRLVKQADRHAPLLLLWSLAAALKDLDRANLSEDVKERLSAEFNAASAVGRQPASGRLEQRVDKRRSAAAAEHDERAERQE